MYNRFKPLPNVFADLAGRNIQATEVGAVPFQQRIALPIHAKVSKPNTRRRGPAKRRGPGLSLADSTWSNHRVFARVEVEGQELRITLKSPTMELAAPLSIYAAVTSTMMLLANIQPPDR
jgi:hypothetical protein